MTIVTLNIYGKFLIGLALFSLIIPGYLSDMDNANADYIDEFSLPYVLEPLTDSQIEVCESIYDAFTTFSDSYFSTRFQNYNFVGNCVMLYEDSLWDYEGSDRYEKLSDKSVELTQEREAELIEKRGNFYIESKSVIELQIPGTFLFKFAGCTGNQTIDLNDVSVVSDKETVLLAKFGDREIPPGVCSTLEIQIRADDPASIKVVISSLDIEVPVKLDEQIAQVVTVEDTLDLHDESQKIHKSPRAQVLDGIVSNEVVCKEGFKLLLKINDDSPACVKESTAGKLIERGWGKLA